jgi:hypothetical protein
LAAVAAGMFGVASYDVFDGEKRVFLSFKLISVCKSLEVLPVSGVGVQLQFIENQWVGKKHPIKIRVFTDVYIRYINAVSWRVTMVCWIGLGFFFFSFHAGRFKTSILGVGFIHTSLSHSTLHTPHSLSNSHSNSHSVLAFLALKLSCLSILSLLR